MSSSVAADTWTAKPLGWQALVDMDRSTLALALCALVLVPVLVSSLLPRAKETDVPAVKPPGPFMPMTVKQVESIFTGMDALRKARKIFGSNKSYKIVTQSGHFTVLPREVATEIRNDRRMDFRKAATDFPPLLLIKPLRLLLDPTEQLLSVIKKHLNKRLNTITGPLAQEATFALNAITENDQKWHEVHLHDFAADFVARLSSRIFLGPELCRNLEWLEITKNYVGASNLAAHKLRTLPAFLWPVMLLADPDCRASRRYRNRAMELIKPVLNARRAEAASYKAKGLPPPVYNDALEWAEIEAVADYNPVDIQLGLSFLAIHTTSDLVSQTLLHLAHTPEGVEGLRREIIQVLSADGWRKASFQKLKLVDSAVKEAQRLKPIVELTMMREAREDVTLSNGLMIPKGQLTAVDTAFYQDPSLFPEPEKFHMRRFYEMRQQPGGEHKSQLVTVSPTDMAFGYGYHACPGRFFASNEVKLALCHLLLKYDWKPAPGTTTEPAHFGTNPMVDPKAKLQYKRRTPEIDLDALIVDDADN